MDKQNEFEAVLKELPHDGHCQREYDPIGGLCSCARKDAVTRLRSLFAAAEQKGWDLAHEPAKCGHARANYKDPKYGTPEYEGEEKCEFCAAVAALKEKRND